MNLIQSLFTSKKFMAMLAGLITIAALKVFKVNIDPQTAGEIVGLIAVYIGAQGISDSGKGAAQVKAIAFTQNPQGVMQMPDEQAKTVDAIKSV